MGTIFGGPHNKDYGILGSILGFPYLGKLPFGGIPDIGATKRTLPNSCLMGGSRYSPENHAVRAVPLYLFAIGDDLPNIRGASGSGLGFGVQGLGVEIRMGNLMVGLRVGVITGMSINMGPY